MSHFACFVTGTDTEVGKTMVSCALLSALGELGVRACGMKPVAAGAVFVAHEDAVSHQAVAAESAAHFTEFNLPLSQAGDFASAVNASNARHEHYENHGREDGPHHHGGHGAHIGHAARDRQAGMPPDPFAYDGERPRQAQAGSWHNEDVDLLIAHSHLPLTAAQVAPYLFRAAAAPHIAAMREQRSIELEPILSAYHSLRAQSEALVVEGVGGFRVPLGHDFDTADLAQKLGLPVILVVGIRLGCLNHALLTAEAIRARGLTLSGWVANMVGESMPYAFDNSAALAARLNAPLLGCVPHMATASAAAVAACLDFSLLPNWPTAHAASHSLSSFEARSPHV
jgi:dethiobiotin synthetase